MVYSQYNKAKQEKKKPQRNSGQLNDLFSENLTKSMVQKPLVPTKHVKYNKLTTKLETTLRSQNIPKL